MRLTSLEREIPEWKSWTAMLRVLTQAVGEPVWQDPVVDPTNAGEARPRLHAQCIRVPEQALSGLVQALLDIAQATSLPSANNLHADRMLRLVHASITGGTHEINVTAQTLGMRAPALAAVLHAATIPLLNACASQLAQGTPGHWPHAYCPVCGERPVLAELLGLDRTRRLRCGSCGTGSDMPWLVCGFCQETDHAQLGMLVAGSGSQGRQVETCATCRGYLKTISVLTADSHIDVLLADLETVALDVAAQDEGFVRPEGPGHQLTVRLFAEVVAP